MIFSAAQRFIFIHVPKAAGTSINAALSPHDVFHPVRTADVATKRAFALTAGVPPALVDLGTHGSAAQVMVVAKANTQTSAAARDERQDEFIENSPRTLRVRSDRAKCPVARKSAGTR